MGSGRVSANLNRFYTGHSFTNILEQVENLSNFGLAVQFGVGATRPYICASCGRCWERLGAFEDHQKRYRLDSRSSATIASIEDGEALANEEAEDAGINNQA